eukprot:7127507-Pyramimonas_sp.AAC.1
MWIAIFGRPRHELLRGVCHRLKEQCDREGIIIKPEQIVRESCYAKDALMTIGRTIPYKAVLGEALNLLQDFETPTTTQQEDRQHLYRARARELALSSMIEKTATERLIISERSRT